MTCWNHNIKRNTSFICYLAILMAIFISGVAETLFQNTICRFNDKTSTYLHPTSGSYTSIDLYIYLWSFGEFFLILHGGDYFHTISETTRPDQPDRAPRWYFHKADCLNSNVYWLSDFTVKSDEDFCQYFVKWLLKDIPQICSYCTKLKKTWFADQGKDEISERKIHCL